MIIFHVALTGDFLNEDGVSAYGDIGLSLLDESPHVAYHFLTELSPRRDDPGYWSRFYSLEVTPDHIREIDGLIVLRPWIKPATFSRGADRLVVIGRSGAGFDKIDLEACTKHGVALFNVPDALNHSTASSALMFMLALSKRLVAQDRVTREVAWHRQAEVLGHEITGRTLGIVGLGRSGRELVRLVAPFDMRVLSYSPHADPAVAQQLGVRLTSLDDLLGESDFVSLHCRLTPQTRRMFGARAFGLMKPTAFFINVARGELVDQRALVAALQSRHIAGAALDVYEREPVPASDPLLSLDNVILAPHWSASSAEVWKATGRATALGMLRAARGEVPDNVVNPEVLENECFQKKLERFRIRPAQ